MGETSEATHTVNIYMYEYSYTQNSEANLCAFIHKTVPYRFLFIHEKEHRRSMNNYHAIYNCVKGVKSGGRYNHPGLVFIQHMLTETGF